MYNLFMRSILKFKGCTAEVVDSLCFHSTVILTCQTRFGALALFTKMNRLYGVQGLFLMECLVVEPTLRVGCLTEYDCRIIYPVG